MPAFHAHIRRFICLLLMTSLVNTAVAGISFFVNDQRIPPNEVAVRYCFDPSTDYRLSRFFAVQPQLAPLPGTGLDMSYKNGMFWISIDLSAFRFTDAQLYAELHNPHINYLGAWLLSGDSVVRDFGVTGDHMPFHTRDVNHPNFVYQLDLRQKDLRLVLMIDKRNEQLHVPVKFLGEDQFLKDNRVGNVLAGLMTGISIFILLFTLFLYFNIREKLYIYYALYVLMVAGYIFSDLGYSFMYFYPNRPGLADFARPLTISLGPLFYIIFSRELLGVRHYFPRMYRFTNWYIGFFLLCFACGFWLVPNTGTIRVFWLVFMQVLMVVSILPVFAFSIMGWRRNIKYSGYIIFASSLFTFFTQLYMQYITGNTADNLFTRNAVNIGFSIEISLLALALSIRFKNYKLDAEDLLRKLNRQQENIFKNISEYQEKEMRRISALLHDSVGAGLSSIKFNLEAIENGNGSRNRDDLIRGTIEDVTSLTDEIRNISHNLSPLLLQKKGLVQGIRDLIEQY
ncbi:MAG TPA: 7TM diverse intracellular signaling domain-containing protein, partial [Flavisolibacter sp.]